LFKFKDIQSGDYQVRAEEYGFGVTSVNISLATGQSSAVDITLFRIPEAASSDSPVDRVTIDTRTNQNTISLAGTRLDKPGHDSRHMVVYERTMLQFAQATLPDQQFEPQNCWRHPQPPAR